MAKVSHKQSRKNFPNDQYLGLILHVGIFQTDNFEELRGQRGGLRGEGFGALQERAITRRLYNAKQDESTVSPQSLPRVNAEGEELDVSYQFCASPSPPVTMSKTWAEALIAMLNCRHKLLSVKKMDSVLCKNELSLGGSTTQSKTRAPSLHRVGTRINTSGKELNVFSDPDWKL